MATIIVRRCPSRSRARMSIKARKRTTIVAALMTASTCGKSRMAIMAASKPVLGDLDHHADIEERRERGQEDEHEQVALLGSQVEVRHAQARARTIASASIAANSTNR